MRQLAEGAGEHIVFAVVGGVLEVVAGADGMFAVVAFGFVVVEVDLAKESVLFGLVVFLRRGEWGLRRRTSARDA